jgi:signal transduction histidine kinase
MEYHFPDEPVIVTLANSALHQVLYHLLRHAAQSVPPTESVHVQVGARKQDARLEIWVADDGPGLSNREREQVLEPFAGDHRQEAARGLGLFLVSQWVNYWGGEVYADSKPGRGSLFTVSCPMTIVRGLLQRNSESSALDNTLGTTDQDK